MSRLAASRASDLFGAGDAESYNGNMIVAGIDEAGYGPLLGPLVVGCCAFELGNLTGEDAAGTSADANARGAADALASSEGSGVSLETPDAPCVWQRLRKFVGKTRSRSGQKLHINDSKLVYSPAGGLKELERAVLALAACSGGWPASLDALLARVAPDAAAHLGRHPWYQAAADESFPVEQPALPLQLFVKGLRGDMDRTATHCVHLGAKVTPERQLNQMFDATRNKSNVLFSLAAGHIDHLLRAYGRQDLVIVCDRQGGRGHYGSLLRLMFEDWSLQIVRETDGRSDYVLSQDGHAVRLTFREKAEAQCLPVAAASMLSKYLRETMMRRFNAYWRQHLPDLRPTAGYYSDGVRFLNDIDIKRREMGVTDAELIRSR